VGRLDDGRVAFVRHGLPGELVDVVITDTQSSFVRADAVTVVTPSPHRVVAPCPYFVPGGCGGCDLQHAGSEAQAFWKASVVEEHLRRIAKVDAEVVIEEPPSTAEGSRTRVRLALDETGHVGLRKVRSNDVVSLDMCWLVSARLRDGFSTTWSGADEVELRDIGEGRPFAVVSKRRGRETVREVRDLSGRPLDGARSRVEVRGHFYEVSPWSFWQSHRDAPAVLVDAVMEASELAEGDYVVDLFSGVGLFSVPLAQAIGRNGSLTAIESSPHAVRDARLNLEGFPQARVRQARVDAKTAGQEVKHGAVVVVDPPRTGLPRGVADALLASQARRIVYVSCDPATFARDLGSLLRGYDVTDLRTFDLFPMTEHVEIVATLDSGG
jgi:tRNA/tmRNA/rRNA uracil-C5-methylase (TrmA/RlmC/RlmD family)